MCLLKNSFIFKINSSKMLGFMGAGRQAKYSAVTMGAIWLRGQRDNVTLLDPGQRVPTCDREGRKKSCDWHI